MIFDILDIKESLICGSCSPLIDSDEVQILLFPKLLKAGAFYLKLTVV